MTPSEYPECVCTAHEKGEDKRKYMFVAECTNEFVVFCCKRCSEICRTAVIQVRTIGQGKEKAKYQAEQQRRSLPLEVREMLEKRKTGRYQYLPKEKNRA